MDKKSHSSAYRWVMFILALLITVITSIEMLLPAPLLTAIIEDTKWSIGAAGQLLSIISLLMGIFVIAGSPIMDKLGLIKLTVISLFVMAIGGIIPFFAGDSYPLHYFGRFLFGVTATPHRSKPKQL